MNLPWIKTCPICKRVYDYEECPFCLAKRKRKEKREVRDDRIE